MASASTSTDSAPGGPVLLYDGDCGLCNRVVRIMLRLDRQGRLRYAPLQGKSAQWYLWAQGLPTEDFDSIVFVPDWAQREKPDYKLRTDGVVAALRAMGGIGRVLAWVGVVPTTWRDAIYRGIARCRYRVFGRWEPKPLSRAEWAARFLE